MIASYDSAELRRPEDREAEDFVRLKEVLRKALLLPYYATAMQDACPDLVDDREGLAALPVTRKSDLVQIQKSSRPFGGMLNHAPAIASRPFVSPGPIFEPEIDRPDPWNGARALFAAGFRSGDVVLNTFSYHLTPGGFLFDSSARALGCRVIPAGPGNVETQLDLIEGYCPVGFFGTPDFLKILVEAAATKGRDISSIKRAAVSGAAFPPSLRSYLESRGIDAYQIYATADVGVIAYESSAREGMIVNEHLIVEIVWPGTGNPVRAGEIGEMVVTSLDWQRPLVRLALGDLTAAMHGLSPCGRTNMRIKGWLGRSDESTKVKGMFVRPEQIAEIGRRHQEIERMRLVVTRRADADQMTLEVETPSLSDADREKLENTLTSVTKLRGTVASVPPGSLPRDGRLISDER